MPTAWWDSVTAAVAIELALAASIALISLGIGLRASPSDVTSLLRRPGLLLRSLLAMNVVMPLLTVAVIELSVSPVPPFLPNKLLGVSRDDAYGYSLLALCGALAIAVVPVLIGVHRVMFAMIGDGTVSANRGRAFARRSRSRRRRAIRPSRSASPAPHFQTPPAASARRCRTSRFANALWRGRRGASRFGRDRT